MSSSKVKNPLTNVPLRPHEGGEVMVYQYDTKIFYASLFLLREAAKKVLFLVDSPLKRGRGFFALTAWIELSHTELSHTELSHKIQRYFINFVLINNRHFSFCVNF